MLTCIDHQTSSHLSGSTYSEPEMTVLQETRADSNSSDHSDKIHWWTACKPQHDHYKTFVNNCSTFLTDSRKAAAFNQRKQKRKQWSRFEPSIVRVVTHYSTKRKLLVFTRSVTNKSCNGLFPTNVTLQSKSIFVWVCCNNSHLSLLELKQFARCLNRM